MARRDDTIPGASMSRKTVLVARLSALGDVAISIPLIHEVCRTCSDTRFIFLTKPGMTGLFVNAPVNLSVLPVDFSQYRGAAGLWRLASRLCKEYGISIFVDLHDVVRTKLLRIFLGLRGVRCVSIDKGRAEKRALTRQRRKRLVQLKTSAIRYLETFGRAGILLPADAAKKIASPSAPPGTVYAPGAGPAEAFSTVSPPKTAGEYWLAVAPFAAHKGKIYPPGLMREVIMHFAAQKGVRIFLFGFGKNEENEIDRLCAGCADTVNMARARLGIGAELALLSHCDAMLSMDSANMHLASLAGLRAVTVWGATHPCAGFYGAGQNPADAIQLDMDCRPCSIFGNRPCRIGGYPCLTQIPAASINSKLQAIALLQRQTPSGRP